MGFFSRKTRPATSDRSPSRTFRPRLELMEDRSVPSAGALDPTFGTGGVVTTKVSTAEDTANAVALQTDGKIVAAGTTNPSGASSSGAFVVLRYNTNGSLDNSFGSGGKTITDIDSRKGDGANAVAIDYAGSPATNANYGKIYAAGWVDVSTSIMPSDTAFALVRYNTNGTLDTSFGGSKAKGKVITNFTSGSESAYGVAVQSNGKIVVTGVGNDIVMARYNANGTLDSTFGNQGKVITDDGIATDGAVGGMVLQADGKIVVVGRGSVIGSGGDVSVLARYNGNGSLDGSFGANGLVTTLKLYSGTVALQPDGKLVAGGTTYVNSSPHWAFARFEISGALDASFATSGTVVTDTIGVAKAVALDAVGKIVAAGWTSGAGGDTALMRLNADGSLDATFGTGGLVQTSISQFGDFANDVVIQPDGKIVTAGHFDSRATATDPSDRDIALARYEGDALLQAASAAPNPSATTLTAAQVQPLLLTEALARWQAAGADTSALHGIDVRIADLGGTTLGLASGHTIWLDDNAAGWGWFVDPTPKGDSEFTTRGNSSERSRMGLLTVLVHEVGHLLGHEHEKTGVMIDNLSPQVRNTPRASTGSDRATADGFVAAETTDVIGNKKRNRGRGR